MGVITKTIDPETVKNAFGKDPSLAAKQGEADINVQGDMTNLELSPRAIYLIKCALERKKEAENQTAAKTLPTPQQLRRTGLRCDARMVPRSIR